MVCTTALEDLQIWDRSNRKEIRCIPSLRNFLDMRVASVALACITIDALGHLAADLHESCCCLNTCMRRRAATEQASVTEEPSPASLKLVTRPVEHH